MQRGVNRHSTLSRLKKISANWAEEIIISINLCCSRLLWNLVFNYDDIFSANTGCLVWSAADTWVVCRRRSLPGEAVMGFLYFLFYHNPFVELIISTVFCLYKSWSTTARPAAAAGALTPDTRIISALICLCDVIFIHFHAVWSAVEFNVLFACWSIFKIPWPSSRREARMYIILTLKRLFTILSRSDGSGFFTI